MAFLRDCLLQLRASQCAPGETQEGLSPASLARPAPVPVALGGLNDRPPVPLLHALTPPKTTRFTRLF